MANRANNGTLLLLFALVCTVASGQPAPQPPGVNPAQPPITLRPDYVLGSNDQVLIRSPQAAEINDRPFRVDADGFVDLPIVGRIRAAGKTVQAFETELVTRLREYIREPQVYITLAQFRDEPIFLVGAFKTPGIFPLQGRRTLVELLSSVGGLQPNASRRIRITRRAEYGVIPLPGAVENREKKVSTVEIGLQSLTESVNPEEDILLQPYDVITADRAERIYVTGEVARSSAVELGERNSISVAQALTEAGGLTQFADRGQARILRPILGTNRRAEIKVNLKELFAGRVGDFPLLPNDVLYIARSGRAAIGPVGTSLLASLPYLVITTILR